MTRRSRFFSIAATHFHARSEAVIVPRALKFAPWPAGMQLGFNRWMQQIG